MSIARKAVDLLFCIASPAVAVTLMATTARAQSDPFGSLYAPPPGSGPAPSTRTGVTGVTGPVGRSYAGSQEGGFASLGQIGMLPKVVPSLPLRLKPRNPKVSAKRPRILAPAAIAAMSAAHPKRRSGTSALHPDQSQKHLFLVSSKPGAAQ